MTVTSLARRVGRVVGRDDEVSERAGRRALVGLPMRVEELPEHLDAVHDLVVAEQPGGQALERIDRVEVVVALEPVQRGAVGREAVPAREVDDLPVGQRGAPAGGGAASEADQGSCRAALLAAGAAEHVDRLGHLVAGRELQPAALVAQAVAQVGREVGAVALVADTVAGRELQALDVGARDDVHDAGYRIGAVDRRSAVLQHLDAADDRRRNGVQVRGAVGAGAAVDHSAAVEQYERAVDAEPAQIDRRRAPAPRRPVGVALAAGVARRGRQTLQQRLDIDHAGLGDLRRADHRRRADAFNVRTLDATAGDDNLAHITAVRRLRHRIAGRHQRRTGARHQKPFAEPVHDQPPWIPCRPPHSAGRRHAVRTPLDGCHRQVMYIHNGQISEAKSFGMDAIISPLDRASAHRCEKLSQR